MRKRAFISTLMLLAGTAPAASAADLETVVVTATRSAQPAALTGESISVITADELQRQQISFVNDALSQVPGLTSVRNGGVGQNATIGVRGAPAGQTLVLIDGVRINDASSTDGQALLGDLLANNIDRIEILRGPQSTLYGSDAMGGVVNVLTRRGGDAPVSGTALAEGGSFDTFHANAAVNGTVDGIEYGGAVNSYATNSVSAADARNGNSEADGSHNFGATGNVRVPVNDWMSVDLRAYYAHARGSFDGYPPPSYTFQDTHEFNRNTLFAGYAGLNITALDGRLHNRLGFMGSSSNRENFDPTMGPANNYFGKGSAARFEYQGVFDLDADNQIVFGAESERTTFKTQSVFDFPPVPTLGARRITSGYGQWQTTLFDQLTLTGGVRYDGDSEFGGHTSLKFAGAWQLPDGATVLHANYGDGFKAPTLYEMYSQYSNPLHALAPETARGWEVGAARQFLDGDLSASLTWFSRHTHNQIDFVSPPCYTAPAPAICAVRPFGYYENLVETRARGIEAEVVAQLPWDVAAHVNYTFLDTRDEGTLAPLARRPAHSGNAGLVWTPMPGATLGTEIAYIGPRFDSPAKGGHLPGYALVNVFGEYPVAAHLTLFGRIENLFDRHYEPVLGYGAAGRAAYAGLRVAF